MSADAIVDALVECLQVAGDFTARESLERTWVVTERHLSEDGYAYFVANPKEDRAPYAVFVYVARHSPGTPLPWRLVPCVGQQQIDAGRQGAYAQIVSGELGRNIVRRHAG